MRPIWRILLLFCFVLALEPAAFAEKQKRIVVTTNDADYFGFDLRAEEEVTLDGCKKLCLSDNECRAFTYNSQAKWCFLKSDFSRIVPFEGAVAGKVVTVSAEPDLGSPPALKFLPAGYAAAALALRSEIRELPLVLVTSTPDEFVSYAKALLDKNNEIETLRILKQALRLADEDPQKWSTITRTAGSWIIGSRWFKDDLKAFVSSAATAAYQLSRTATQRSAALVTMAENFERNDLFREAIIAYRTSLELRENANVRQAYLRLYRDKGFRVKNHEIEADILSPRVCVEFSEKLAATRTNYENFVTVEGTLSTALSVSGSRLCVEGLKHGSEYRLVLRAGLPSMTDEALPENIELNTYIRDRTPAVRFTGDNFVLASAARRAIPIVSINAESADLELYRIGERSLSNLLSGSKFLSQLRQYSASELAKNTGQSIWKGKIELSTDLNKNSVTSFPIDEVLPDRKPGIYVLTASVTGLNRDSWDPVATQWFLVSDLGLVTYAGNDGLNVFANSLDSGKPLSGVDLQLVARNNEVLGSVVTDDMGRAKFDPGLMRGTAGLSPTVVIAKHDSRDGLDFVFLDLSRAGFDLSDRGVEGRASPGPIDAFTYLDRGIYRPGETVHVTTLLRDHVSEAITDLPLTIVLSRPDSVEAERVVSRQPLLGGHGLAFDIPENAMRGVWKVQIHTDPNTTPISEKQFLVEDFSPDRIEFDLTTSSETVVSGLETLVELEGRYLYGAPASNLALEGEVRLTTVRELAAAKGYQFGLDQEKERGTKVSKLKELPLTDDSGRATIPIRLDSLPQTTRPLVVEVTVRMKESGGRAVERSVAIPVRTDAPMIGIRPQFEVGQLEEGKTAGFKVIALDQSGSRADMNGLNWSLYRIERNYQWYRSGSNWRYEAVEIPRMIENGRLDARAKIATDIAFPVEWGRYRLDVVGNGPNSPATSVHFNAGWYVESSSTETPDALEIALDKPFYRVGETATLKVTAQYPGELLVAIGADRIVDAVRVGITAGDNEVELEVNSEWGTGVYVTATAFKPGSVVNSRLPARSIGTTWLSVDPEDRALSVSLDLPEKTKPEGLLTIPVKVEGLQASEEAYVTVAAVDVGILNLTRYSPPSPSKWYFGQRQLGLELRDLYGKLIDGSQGQFGRVRSGGDGPGMTAQGSPPTQELLSLYSGVVKLDESGQAEISFYLPQFNGTARIMAVVWSKRAVGQASHDLIIRDPIITTASLPKVLAPGDSISTVVEIHNTDGVAGTYDLSIEASANVELGETPSTIKLDQNERRVVKLSMEALEPGTAELGIEISLDGYNVSQVSQKVEIRPATLPVALRSEFQLASNVGSIRLDGNLLGDSFVHGSEVGVSVSRYKSFDLASLLMRLDRYPYGCAEQTVSRALPLLYLSELNAPENLIETKNLDDRINSAISRVISFQSASGSFGMWGPGSGNLWLDAYVSDFLTRAREKEYKVPKQAMRLAIQNLQNRVAEQGKTLSRGDAVAYGLYVLARNRMASAADLRYYADTRLNEFKTPLARAHLAAALYLYNEQVRSKRTFSSSVQMANKSLSVNYSNDYYGSLLRDGAAMLALAGETSSVQSMIPEIVKFVSSEIIQGRLTSTQEDAWLVLAARAVGKANRDLALVIDGMPVQGAINEKITGADLITSPVTIENKGDRAVTAVVTRFASPLTPLPASSNGYQITRKYYRLDGVETSLNEVRQNERFIVVLTVSEFDKRATQILVTDLLAGGFEIDNPNLVKSAQLDNFDWLDSVKVAHTEARNDRFLAAYERKWDDPRTFNLAYMVRAVTPGRYSHPAATVENMYSPERSARTATGFVEILSAN